MIGASRESIDKAEDREQFREAMTRIGLDVPRAVMVHDLESARAAQPDIGFPTIVRPSFTLGGSGGGIAYNREEFVEVCERGLDASPTREVLLEESVLGWKEFEMEVVRDCKDNCIIICAIENFDAMGVHTGDSITVAPAQTLTDKEYQLLRDASIAVLREIGVDTGGSNVQFAINPSDGHVVIIEMNPRVSRSSALASKATGFPIARVAAKLAIGYTLDELDNEITGGATPASFEPTIDYVVTKVPRFNFEKFPQTEPRLGTQMKSVGEAMAIGRTFQESLQKALRSLENDLSGLDEIVLTGDGYGLGDSADIARAQIVAQLRNPGPERLRYLADGLRLGMDVAEIHEHSGVDPWFIAQIQELVGEEQALDGRRLGELDRDQLLRLKRRGFSDQRLARLLGVGESDVRRHRHALGVRPVFKRVDSCAAEFEASTAYMYSTYEEECEAQPTERHKIMVLGGGPNRIGQGIEFDYCCVQAALAVREFGYEAIMVNCNPETVSTDYDTSDRLYFEPLTLEDVLEIIHVERPDGIIVQYGGQTPLKLSRDLEAAGARIIGTTPESIDLAEDRERFQKLIQDLDLRQPPNCTARTSDEAVRRAAELGYPLVVRPSYVLGGRAMEIVYGRDDLEAYMRDAVAVSNSAPVLLDRFLDDAIEVDVDAISDGREVLVCGVMEHIEQAGVHSGDSACSLPPRSLSPAIQARIREQTRALAHGLEVVGLMNVQFAIQRDQVYVLEVNPRASRTVPFVSKATGVALARVATRCMLGQTLADQNQTSEVVPEYFSVKEAVFPFVKFPGVDTLLGPEMKSTGEVMGVGRNFGEAFAKALLAAGDALPTGGSAFLSVKDGDKEECVQIGRALVAAGFNLVASRGTRAALAAAGVPCTHVNKVQEGRPHVVDLMKNGAVDLIVNTTEGRQAIADSFTIRRTAVQHKVPYTTTMSGAKAMVMAIRELGATDVNRLQDLHRELAV